MSNNTLRRVLEGFLQVFRQFALYLRPDPLVGLDIFCKTHGNFTLFEAYDADTISEIADGLEEFLTSFRQFEEAFQDLQEDIDIEALTAVGQKITNIYQVISTFELPDTEDAELKRLPSIVLEALLSDYIFNTHPSWFSGLRLIGLVDEPTNKIAWHKFSILFSQPFDLLKSYYNWDTTNLRIDLLEQNSVKVLTGLNIFPSIEYLSTDTKEILPALTTGENEYTNINIPLARFFDDNGLYNELGFKLVIYHDKEQGRSNFCISFYGGGSFDGKIAFDDNTQIALQSSINANIPFFIVLNQEGFRFKSLEVGQISDTYLKVCLDSTNLQDGKSRELFKGLGSSFEIGHTDSSIEYLYEDGEYDIRVTLKVRKSKFVLSTQDADGFLSKVLGTEQEIPFSFSGIYSTRDGFYFEGSSALEIEIPSHFQVGPLSFRQLAMSVSPKAHGVALAVTTDIGASLGIIEIGVTDIGLSSEVNIKDFPSGTYGNLGPIDLKVGFKPPSQISLSVNNNLLSGGGFLAYFPEDESYAGGLQLSLQKIGITAVGVISTRMPDGSKNFSMVISMSVQFNPGIPLPFGFSLNGVGGLVGINRRMEVDVLKERIRTGAVDSIMFPEDFIANADRIIGDLRAVFPAQEGTFVVGPFLRLGWGTPKTLLEVDLGIFIELPSTRVLLLGRLRTALPDEESPILVLNIEVFGDLSFRRRELLVFGVVRDSRIAIVELSGEFMCYLSWGRQTRFFFSAGGYHPAYEPPTGLPVPKRLRAAFNFEEKNVQIRFFAEAYLAITPNSFQFGFDSALDVWWTQKHLGTIHLEGRFRFDTLLYFKPFRFQAEMEFSVIAYYQGKDLASVQLYMWMSGPAPWHVIGRASFKLGVKWGIDFELQWGQQAPAPTQLVVNPTTGLLEQLRAPQNWRSLFAPEWEPDVELRQIESSKQPQQEQIMVHPFSSLAVTQSILPLDFSLEKFGDARIYKKAAIACYR